MIKNPVALKIWRNASKFAGGNNSGFVLALTAIVLPLLFLIMAFSIETSLAFSEQSKMQAAADHAARYASILRSQSRSLTYITNGAQAIAKANGYTHDSSACTDATISNPCVKVSISQSGLFANSNSWVEVIIQNNRNSLLPDFLGRTKIPQKVRAVATWDQSPCIVALSTATSGPTGSFGVTKTDNSIFTAGCGIWSNSPSTTDSMQVTSGEVRSNGFYFATTGNVRASTAGNLKNFDGSAAGPATFGAPVFSYPDQFKNLSTNLDAGVPASNVDNNTIVNASSKCVPTSSAVGSYSTTSPMQCTYTQTTTTTTTVPVYTKVKGVNTQTGTTTQTTTTTAPVTVNMYDANGYLDPQYYYDNLNVGGTINLKPGARYYINGLTMNSSAAIINGTGGNALLIAGSGASLTLSGGAALNINPLTVDQDATYYGISILSGLTNVTDTTMTGGSGGTGVGINGVVGLPNAKLKLSGGSQSSQNCQTFYAAAVFFNGTGGIGNGCNTTLTNMSAFRSKNLVE